MAERIKLADTANAEVDSILQKLNIKMSALSQIVAPSRNANYLSSCLFDGRMPLEVVEMLATMGADKTKLVKPETKTEPVSQADPNTDTVRKAVTNGIMDAWLIIQKQNDANRKAMLKEVIAEVLQDEELRDILQYMLYSAINGALAKQSNGSTNMHDGLVPQRW